MSEPEGVKRLLDLSLAHVHVLLWHIESGHSDLLHSHEDCYQLSIPLGGGAILESNGVVKPAHQGLSLMNHPGDLHQHHARGRAARFQLIFIEEAFLRRVVSEETCQEQSSPEFMAWDGHTSESMLTACAGFLRAMTPDSISSLDPDVLEWGLVSCLLSARPGSHSGAWGQRSCAQPFGPIDRVVQAIQDAYSQPLDLGQLASIAGLSRFHFARAFKRQLGRSPMDYVREIRLQQALQLLRTSSMEVTRIALDVGFENQSSFYRQFRSRFGLSPMEVRRKGTSE